MGNSRHSVGLGIGRGRRSNGSRCAHALVHEADRIKDKRATATRESTRCCGLFNKPKTGPSSGCRGCRNRPASSSRQAPLQISRHLQATTSTRHGPGRLFHYSRARRTPSPSCRFSIPLRSSPSQRTGAAKMTRNTATTRNSSASPQSSRTSSYL